MYVCRAQCCRVHDEGIICPNLQEDCSCGIYKERYAEGSPDLVTIGMFVSSYRHINGEPLVMKFDCGKIDNLLRDGDLPDFIADKCVYKHPELLEEYRDAEEIDTELDAP